MVERTTVSQDGELRQQQRILDVAAGDSAVVGAGGSTFAESGGIGTLRNNDENPLVLLLVALAPAAERWASEGQGETASTIEIARPRHAKRCQLPLRPRGRVERRIAGHGRHHGSPCVERQLGRRAGIACGVDTVALSVALERHGTQESIGHHSLRRQPSVVGHDGREGIRESCRRAG